VLARIAFTVPQGIPLIKDTIICVPDGGCGPRAVQWDGLTLQRFRYGRRHTYILLLLAPQVAIVDHELRFTPAFQRAKELLRDGAIGTISAVESTVMLVRAIPKRKVNGSATATIKRRNQSQAPSEPSAPTSPPSCWCAPSSWEPDSPFDMSTTEPGAVEESTIMLVCFARSPGQTDRQYS